ncbi:OmpA family protein [Rhodopseudomonas sp. B29]|uniref:OmpA family protein n=1 Tax=Rhodopseudomonas sp. B29 TaxID=95607 RepID=UPI001FCA6FB7|nr:OmpA family protein [Rhodopseudomonas sp. B29]
MTHYWLWLAAAAIVGVATPIVADKFGWAADLENYWLSRMGVVVAILLVLVAGRLLSGQSALLLEIAVGLLLAYVAGGLLGGAKGGLLPVRFEGWWVGLFATFLIWGVFAITTAPKIAPDLREAVAEVVKEAKADPLNFDVSGRDVLLPADLGAARTELVKEIAQVPGVRRVDEVDDLTGPALAAKTVAKLQAEVAAKQAADKVAAEKEAAEKAAAEKAAAEKLAADKAETARRAKAEAKAAAEKVAAEKAAAEKLASEKLAAEEAARQAAAKAAAEKAAAESAKPKAATEIKTANAAGEIAVTPAQACQSNVSALATAEKINFERRSATIDKASLPVLTKLAAAIAQCPAVTIEVAGYTDAAGKKAANETLSKRRAEAVVASLAKLGTGSAKLVAAGYGADKPLASNDTPEGRAQNRRIEFVVK